MNIHICQFVTHFVEHELSLATFHESCTVTSPNPTHCIVQFYHTSPNPTHVLYSCSITSPNPTRVSS